MWVLGNILHELHFFLKTGLHWQRSRWEGWAGWSKWPSWFSPLRLVAVAIQVSGWSGKEGNSARVEWKWKVTDEERGERREGLSKKRWWLTVAKEKSTRKSWSHPALLRTLEHQLRKRPTLSKGVSPAQPCVAFWNSCDVWSLTKTYMYTAYIC